MLSIEQKESFLRSIIELRQSLDGLKTNNTLQELERFENQLILNELEACFSDTSSEICETRLTERLAQRWERIRGSSMCYTQKPTNPVNQLCLQLAMALSAPITTPLEIEALQPGTGPYCLLMPSLQKTDDIYGGNIHSLQPQEFVLSDNERVFIPLVTCLHQASVSDTGRLRHMVEIGMDYPHLTPGEAERVSGHSKEATRFYQAILALNMRRLSGDEIGARLSQLALALRGGGSYSGSGSELNAGSEANLGILAFHDYWTGLSEQQQTAIYIETPELRSIIGRLFRPGHVDYEETRFCVELLADALDPLIEQYNKRPSVQTLINKVKTREQAFVSALEKPQDLQITQTRNPPKRILHLIFELSVAEQGTLFKHDKSSNALQYALANDPDALVWFGLDDEAKQQAVLARIKPENDSGLIVAAKHGSISAIELLLQWGCDTTSCDSKGSDALHWAAINGHVDAVSCLLAHGAALESRGFRGNTALNWAVYRGRTETVELLLQNNADPTVRNEQGMNALDLAIKHHPELIESILMRLATLPADEQAECLLNVPNGPYPNVLFYAAAHKKYLFDRLLATILDQPGITAQNALFTTPNENGVMLLLLAAKAGSVRGINELIRLGVDRTTCDSNGSDALSWAATNGHVGAVDCLLTHGAELEARGYLGNTALNWAVRYGITDAVELLLQNNANPNARNNLGMNALDLAIKHHPRLVKPILMQLATLSADEQGECLLNVPGGPYPNVLSYAADHKKYLFDPLLTLVLEQPGMTIQNALFTTLDAKGNTPLMFAALSGSIHGINELIRLGMDITSCNSMGSNALHWAAIEGHTNAVSCLLAHGAELETRGYLGNTALNWAVRHGKTDTVALLLQNNADLNARNEQGMNALDLAIKHYPKLVEPILMRLMALPADEQAEYLLNVPAGPCPNVFFYAATVNTILLKALLRPFDNPELDDRMRPVYEAVDQIGFHYREMVEKARDNPNYISAVLEAKTLLETCIDETLKLYRSSDTIDVKLSEFKTGCLEAIKTARPVLAKYREWGKITAEALLAVITLPISLPLYAVGFFSVKTRSEQLLDTLQSNVNQLG